MPYAVLEKEIKRLDEAQQNTMDALHLASAEAASCDWFLTTDRGILKKVREVGGMRVANPVEFITWRADND